MARTNAARSAIAEMTRRLVKEVQPQKIVLFGSHAYGKTDRDSDIDLLIIAESSDDFFQRLMMVRKVVSGLHDGIPLDPIVLTPQEVAQRLEAGDQFISEALEKGEILYGG